MCMPNVPFLANKPPYVIVGNGVQDCEGAPVKMGMDPLVCSGHHRQQAVGRRVVMERMYGPCVANAMTMFWKRSTKASAALPVMVPCGTEGASATVKHTLEVQAVLSSEGAKFGLKQARGPQLDVIEYVGEHREPQVTPSDDLLSRQLQLWWGMSHSSKCVPLPLGVEVLSPAHPCLYQKPWPS